MSKHAAQAVVLTTPHDFETNIATLQTNKWQVAPHFFNAARYKKLVERERAIVLGEHRRLYETLINNNIPVDVFRSNNPKAPDAVFPDTIITLPGSDIKGGDPEISYAILCPMYENNRQIERNMIIPYLKKLGYEIIDIFDRGVEHYESQPKPMRKAFEGKGAVRIDPMNKIIYCALSERCHLHMARQFRDALNDFKLAAFFTTTNIYHTDVGLTLATHHAEICEKIILQEDYNIKDVYSRKKIMGLLNETKNGNVFNLSIREHNNFCGNTTELSDADGNLYTLMSDRAYRNYNPDTLEAIQNLGSRIIHTPLNKTEQRGGGSANCALLELRGIESGNLPGKIYPPQLWTPN